MKLNMVFFLYSELSRWRPVASRAGHRRGIVWMLPVARLIAMARVKDASGKRMHRLMNDNSLTEIERTPVTCEHELTPPLLLLKANKNSSVDGN